MNIQELIDEAYLNWIEKNYAYMLFDHVIKTKWRHLTLEQGGTI